MSIVSMEEVKRLSLEAVSAKELLSLPQLTEQARESIQVAAVTLIAPMDATATEAVPPSVLEAERKLRQQQQLLCPINTARSLFTPTKRVASSSAYPNPSPASSAGRRRHSASTKARKTRPSLLSSASLTFHGPTPPCEQLRRLAKTEELKQQKQQQRRSSARKSRTDSPMADTPAPADPSGIPVAPSLTPPSPTPSMAVPPMVLEVPVAAIVLRCSGRFEAVEVTEERAVDDDGDVLMGVEESAGEQETEKAGGGRFRRVVVGLTLSAVAVACAWAYQQLTQE